MQTTIFKPSCSSQWALHLRRILPSIGLIGLGASALVGQTSSQSCMPPFTSHTATVNDKITGFTLSTMRDKKIWFASNTSFAKYDIDKDVFEPVKKIEEIEMPSDNWPVGPGDRSVIFLRNGKLLLFGGYLLSKWETTAS